MIGWSQVPLGDFLMRSDEWVKPDPGKIYKRITARLWGKGLTLRAKASGSTIAATRQVCARSGQFLVSRIDARHGAFGIVPDELDGALVSNDFPCFDIDSRLAIPHYFEWYSRTPTFVDLCRRASEGSTNRVRLKESDFLDMRIPLPPLDEQRRIVARLDRVAGLIEERRKAVATADADMRALLSKAFERAIKGVSYRPMAEIAPLVRRPVDVQPNQNYPELGVRSFGRGTFHKPSLQGIEVGSKKLFRIQSGDLIFNIVFAWEGAVAIAGEADDGRVGSHRFLTCVPDPDTATSDFLRFYFLTPEGLRKLGEASPGGAGRNRTLGLNKLATAEVPIPPLDQQRQFDRLLFKVRQVRRIRDGTTQDVDALSSATLHEEFGSMGNGATCADSYALDRDFCDT